MSFDVKQPHLHDLGYLLAEASKNVVFVVGAGLSAPAGIPMWPGLCELLISALEDNLAKRPRSERDAADAELEKARSYKDLWHLGDYLRRTLEPQIYTETIQESLAVHNPDNVPDAYDKIWKLEPSGVLNFNLDICAELALKDCFTGQVATGIDEAQYRRFLLYTRPFLFQPHGKVTRPETWVLGAHQRNELLNSKSYRHFILQLLGSRRLVIVGFRPDDLAFQSLLLDDFRDAFEEGIEHFWITTPLDADREAFADLYSLNPIIYEPSDRSHPEVAEILSALSSFKPRTLEAPIVYRGETISPHELPPEESLRTEMVESIRRKLNAALGGATFGMETQPEATNQAISDLLKDYSGSMKLAWNVTDNNPYNRLWGYKILGRLGDGAFSNVWRVEDSVDSVPYAIKVMREEIVNSPEMYEAFRRGVHAIRILSERRVEGMVKLVDAFDVPACLVMELIDGVTLEEALQGRWIDSLAEALRVVTKVGQIVLSAHDLKECVLHRDLKPPNVMLRQSRFAPSTGVVVLDFDLSWFEGAVGQSALLGQRLHNYLAPEQVSRDREYSSRHTAVDVFGLGMLLYYVCTEENPPLNAQNTTSFLPDLRDKLGERWSTKFKATPNYIARLIESATYSKQPDRIGLPALIEGIELVTTAEATGSLSVPSGLSIFELSCGLSDIWDIDERTFDWAGGILTARSTVSGTTARFSADGTLGGTSGVRLMLHHDAGAGVQRGGRAKYLAGRGKKAAAIMRKHGVFLEVSSEGGSGACTVSGLASGDAWSMSDVQEKQSVLDDAASVLAFHD